MVSRSFRKVSLLLAFIMLASLLSACSAEGSFSPAPTPESSVPVEVVFREFYRALGGVSTISYAISPVFQKGDSQCQYTENALMCYNPLLSGENRFRLEPIGEDFGTRDDPVLFSETGKNRVINGYVLPNEFAVIYDRLYGGKMAGKPLTQVRFNEEQQRYEQYFQNVGFYRNVNDPVGKVHLLPYGRAHCKDLCGPQVQSAIILTPDQSIEQIFYEQVERIGGVQTYGQPLTRPYIYPDGTIEQAYERAVFYAPKGDLRAFGLRPAALILGLSFSLPGPKNNDSRMVFYPLQGNQGYNVPVIFDYFLAEHGGNEMSGRPISEIQPVAGKNIYRQCFENYCIDYDPTAEESMRIRLAPVGLAYLDQAGKSALVVQRYEYSGATVLLRIGELHPQLRTDETQVIAMVVQQKRSQRALTGLSGSLNLYLPDGSVLEYLMPPTGDNGVSSLTLPPLPSLGNGTVIPYQICLDVESEQPLCAQESYLIWNAN